MALVEAVSLRVRNLERVRAFYGDLLGLAAGVRLEEDPGAPPRPQEAPGLYHLALLLPDRTALGRVLVRLLAAGYPLDGGADHAVSEALYLRDPEGNGVELYADRPRDLWRHRDGQLVMTTEPLDWSGLAALGREHGPAPLPPGTRLGHVHLQVADLGRSEAFYRASLGLAVTCRYGSQAVFLSWGGYHHHLGLNAWASRGQPPAPPGSLGLVEVVFRGEAERRLQDPDGIAVRVVGGAP